MNRASISILLAALLTLALSGCRTTRSAAEKTAAAVSEAEYVRQVSRLSTPDYRTLTATMYVNINPDTKDEMSSRARLKLIRGQSLQISITPLAGIEMFRIEVSRDSLKVIDRFWKRYLAEPIAEIKKQIPSYVKVGFPYDFRYEHLEALLTNRLFMPDGSTLALDRFYNRKYPFGYHTFIARDTEGITYHFDTDNHARLTATEITYPFVELHWSYTKFRTISGHPFPMDMEAEVDERKKLSIEFNNVNMDGPVEMNFPIPDNYRRITLQQLWSIISF